MTAYAGSIVAGVANGCVGLLTQGMMRLYSRTSVKTRVVVLPVQRRRQPEWGTTGKVVATLIVTQASSDPAPIPEVSCDRHFLAMC